MAVNKKNRLKAFLNILKNACVIFTVVSFAFYLLADFFANATQVLTLGRMFLVFLLSVWFAFSNILLMSKKLNIVLRVVLHFVSSMVGFFVIFILLPGNTGETGGNAFIIMICFAVLYLIIAGILLTVRAFIKGKKTEEQSYETVYKKEE